MSGPEHFVIVYQFGKVASTAIVKALNRQPGVEARQSHFLGDDALKRIVVNATGPNLSPYFRKHMIGQLMANLDLTHEMKRIQTGRDGRRLTVISLSREPLTWFRSSIQQDITGYVDAFRALGGASVREGVECMLSHVGDVIAAQGGVAPVVAHILERGGRSFLDEAGMEDEFLKSMLLLALRPMTWFEEHFRRCFHFGLESMAATGPFWVKAGNPTGFVMLRYEDIAESFPAAMAAVGVPFKGEVTPANVSRSKPYADEIVAAFQGDAAMRLRELVQEADYARFFRYDATSSSVLRAATAI
ncbi:MAG: hypothetical protein AAFR73_10685 [Pseudomonadota bacterium]